VTSPAAADLPDYAPVPRSALGPALNEQGCYVGRVERNLYWVTDDVYRSAFLTTRDGVVLFDAPPSIGHNLRRAVDDMATANGVSNTVTHLVNSHHPDDAGAASLATVDPVPFYLRYGENVWAGVKAHLDTVTDRAATPIVAKYTGVLAAADIEIFATTTFAILRQSASTAGPAHRSTPDRTTPRAGERRPRCGPTRMGHR
jgi:hypothetical protein